MSEQLELPFDPPLDRAMKRAEILRTAEEYITKDRAATHGNMEDNFSTIAVYWSEHLGIKVTAIDVAAMMALLKVARLKSSEGNEDNWVDACGYLACGGELACGGAARQESGGEYTHGEEQKEHRAYVRAMLRHDRRTERAWGASRAPNEANRDRRRRPYAPYRKAEKLATKTYDRRNRRSVGENKPMTVARIGRCPYRTEGT
jgi:hypothetical protein